MMKKYMFLMALSLIGTSEVLAFPADLGTPLPPDLCDLHTATDAQEHEITSSERSNYWGNVFGSVLEGTCHPIQAKTKVSCGAFRFTGKATCVESGSKSPVHMKVQGFWKNGESVPDFV